MKVNYKLANGQAVEVEVTEAVAGALEQFERDERSGRRAARRHNEESLESFCEETGWEPIDPTADVTVEVEANEERKWMDKLIIQLTDRQQMVIRLHFYEGYSFAEIAKKVGISKSTVSRHYEYARAALEKNLKNF